MFILGQIPRYSYRHLPKLTKRTFDKLLSSYCKFIKYDVNGELCLLRQKDNLAAADEKL